MAQFMLCLYDDPTKWQDMSPEDMQKAIQKYVAWASKAREGGYFKSSEKLADDKGKVLRGGPGKTRVVDGPYSETKEVLGGFYVIEADDYEQAVQRILDHPHLEYGGTVEIRTVQVIPRG